MDFLQFDMGDVVIGGKPSGMSHLNFHLFCIVLIRNVRYMLYAFCRLLLPRMFRDCRFRDFSFSRSIGISMLIFEFG